MLELLQSSRISPPLPSFCFSLRSQPMSQLDYNGRLSLQQFETLIKPVVERMDAPILKALKDAGITKEQLGSVEIVGGATR